MDVVNLLLLRDSIDRFYPFVLGPLLPTFAIEDSTLSTSNAVDVIISTAKSCPLNRLQVSKSLESQHFQSHVWVYHCYLYSSS